MSLSIRDLIKDFRTAAEITKGTSRLGLILEGIEPFEPLIQEIVDKSQRQDLEVVDLLNDDQKIVDNMIEYSDLLIFGFSGKSVLPKKVYELARQIQYRNKSYMVLVETASLDNLKEIITDISAAADKKADDISVINTPLRVNLDEFAKGCVEMLPEAKQILLGRNYPFFREAAAKAVIARTARQNGVVSTIMFTGAEFPVLTANQVKMLLEIAAVYGEDLDEKRLKELLAVVGTGYTLRTAARSLLGIVPGPQFFIKGAISYFGTWAMGRAAVKYFEDQRLSKVRSALIV